MRIGADQHLYRRRAEQSVGLDIPAHPAQHFAARGGKAGEIGDGGAGNETDRSLGRQTEQIEQPSRSHRLDRGGGGGGQQIARILAPRGGEPVGGDAGGVRIADHPAEEARSGRGADAGCRALDQFRDDRLRIAGLLGRRPGEGGEHVGISRGRRGLGGGDRAAIGDGMARGLLHRSQVLLDIAHRLCSVALRRQGPIALSSKLSWMARDMGPCLRRGDGDVSALRPIRRHLAGEVAVGA
jgi:hypothetical protein